VPSDGDPAAWTPPDYAEVVVITHVLELPQDLRVPSGIAFGLTEQREDVFVDWPDKAKVALTRVPIQTPGWSPVHRLVFRNAVVKTALPLQAADLAFKDYVQPLMPPEEWRERERSLKEAVARGWDVRKTVVAASTFVAPERWRGRSDELRDLLRRQLDESLDFLNDYIVSLSLLRGDPLLVPVSRGDLAAACPVVIEAAPMQEGKRSGTTFIYPIHEHVPLPVVEVEPPEEEIRGDIAEFATYRRYQGFPLFLYYELLHSAEAARRLHRYAQAVATLGTTVEVFINAVIRMIAEARSEDTAQLERALRAPLRNQIEHHLPRYATVTVDLTDVANPFGKWWQGGYQLRKDVIHEGRRPDAADADAAFDDASVLVRAVADGLAEEAEDSPAAFLWPFPSR
jgi:hypothetical protein